MKQHLHIYTTGGRCITSMVLGPDPLHHSIETTLSSRIQGQLPAHGYRLKRWLEAEEAGIATSRDGESYLFRIKRDGTCRNMQTVGVRQVLAQIENDGIDVHWASGLAFAIGDIDCVTGVPIQ